MSRDDMSPPTWNRFFDNWKEAVDFYDEHNTSYGIVSRTSADPIERMHGRCGCYKCAIIRKEWQDIPAPINRQGRSTNSMSSVNLCERPACSNMATGNAIGAVSIVASGERDAVRKHMELCPRCIGEMMDFLNTPPTSGDQTAFREGWKPPQAEDDVDKATPEQLAAALFEKLMKNAQRELVNGNDSEDE